MTDKVVRLAVGTDDMSIRCIVSLIFTEGVEVNDVVPVLQHAAESALDRFLEGPHEDAIQ